MISISLIREGLSVVSALSNKTKVIIFWQKINLFSG